MILKIFRMLSRCAVEIHTLPVNQDYLFLKHPPFEGYYWGLHSYRSDKLMGRQIFGMHPMYQETFLQIHKLLLQLFILKNWTLFGKILLKNRFTCPQRRRVRDQNEIKIWDASLDRQPKIQSYSVEETIRRIMRQTNNDCRFRISTLTSSLRQQLFACLKISFKKPRYVLVHNFPRKQCNGSRKWSLLIQWMNWDLRHLFVVFQCRILKYLMRGLLQHWTESSIIASSKGESVCRNKKPRKRTVSFEVDRLPTWSTITSGSLEPMILSKTTPTCSPLFFEMTIFRNSIPTGTEFYYLWRKSHMMTSWKDCTN